MKAHQPWSPRSLGGKLLALVAACAVLPLVAMAAAHVWFERQEVERAAVELLHARADHLATELDYFHDFFGSATVRWATVSAAVEVLSHLPSAPTAAVAQLQFSLDKVRTGDPRLQAIAVVDAAGRTVEASADQRPPAGAVWPAFANLVEAIKRAERGHHAVVPLIEPGQPARLVYGRAIGTPAKGYVLFVVKFESFWQAVQRSDDKAGPGSHSVVVDEFGVRVAHSRSAELLFRPTDSESRATSELLARSNWYGPQTAQWMADVRPAPEMAKFAGDPSLDRVFRGQAQASLGTALIVQRSLRHVPWTLFYCLPERAVQDRLWMPFMRGSAMAMVFVAVALVLGWFLARRIVQAQARLRAAVARLRAGDLSGRVDLEGNPELGDLLRDFNDMAESLRQSHDELEARVAERTADLQQALATIRVANEDLTNHAHELAAQTEELQAQQEELNQRSRELQEADSHKSRFLTNKSHELSTPLNAIIGFSDLLLHDAGHIDDTERKQFIGDIYSSGQHLLHLINDLLDLARIEAGHLKLELDAVYPRAAIDEAIDVVSGFAKSRDVRIEVASVSQLPVVADRLRLRQVLVNLVGNAIKFSPPGAVVQLGAEKAEDGHKRFWVRDQGPGMADDLRARLFEPFVQGDDSLARQHAGSGLGLAISRTLVDAMGGRIGVESAPNVGSRFWFTLPKAAGETLPAKRVTLSGHFSQTLHGVKVLVCCRDERDAAALADPLMALGAEVRQTATMVASLESALSDPPAVCVCDDLLADGSADQLFSALRSDPETAKVAQIMILASSGRTRSTPGDDRITYAIKGTFSGDDWVATVERAAGLCARPVPQLEPVNGQPCVLVADDNDVNRALVARIVHRVGARVVSAADGRQAVDLARLHKPALALLDLAMPELDGYGTLAALRADPALARIPCVAVTAMAMRADEARAIAAGFDEFVTKPIDVTRFEAMVRRWILTGKTAAAVQSSSNG